MYRDIENYSNIHTHTHSQVGLVTLFNITNYVTLQEIVANWETRGHKYMLILF